METGKEERGLERPRRNFRIAIIIRVHCLAMVALSETGMGEAARERDTQHAVTFDRAEPAWNFAVENSVEWCRTCGVTLSRPPLRCRIRIIKVLGRF